MGKVIAGLGFRRSELLRNAGIFMVKVADVDETITTGRLPEECAQRWQRKGATGGPATSCRRRYCGDRQSDSRKPAADAVRMLRLLQGGGTTITGICKKVNRWCATGQPPGLVHSHVRRRDQ
jgi:hypothetical protein